MAYTVRDLPRFTPSSSGSVTSNEIGSLDDAEAIGIYITSSANTGSSATGLIVQVAQYDPAIGPIGTQSTQWFRLVLASTVTGGSTFTLSTGSGHTIAEVAFRGIRLHGLTSAPAGEVLGFVTKQILV
jgi:hypothetical protein